METYKNSIIAQDSTGYAPQHLMFSFFTDDGEECLGNGETIEDCKEQIDELINI